jgi:hypothetical protein
MKYKLQFVKTSPQHEIAGIGFGGNILNDNIKTIYKV